jgi:hypothetical protein
MNVICPCGCGDRLPRYLSDTGAILAAMVPLQNRLVQALSNALEVRASDPNWRFANHHYRLMRCDERGFEIMMGLIAHVDRSVGAATPTVADLLADLDDWRMQAERALAAPAPAPRPRVSGGVYAAGPAT